MACYTDANDVTHLIFGPGGVIGPKRFWDIDNSDEMVGDNWETLTAYYYHPALDAAVEVDSLVENLPPGYHIRAATAVNDRGQIIGYGVKAEAPGNFTFRLDPIMESVDIAGAKSKGNCQRITCGGIVTAAFKDFFYMESPDRQSGIRVGKHGFQPDVDDGVSVEGVVATLPSGERYIAAAVIGSTTGGHVLPVGLNNKSVGGADYAYDAGAGSGQVGVQDGDGLNNVGMLVCVWGKVIESGEGYAVIDDGSGVTVRLDTSYLVEKFLLQDDRVAVNGPCSLFKTEDGTMTRLVIARGDSDVNKF